MQLIVALGASSIQTRPDVPLVAMVSSLLILIALGACAIPARRIRAVNAVAALRQE
jgi:ABC-type lipoprotein release transport system permease subunit